jgi:hypothetical protein
MFLLVGCDEKNPRNEAESKKETRQNCPVTVSKNVAISILFSEAQR